MLSRDSPAQKQLQMRAHTPNGSIVTKTLRKYSFLVDLFSMKLEHRQGTRWHAWRVRLCVCTMYVCIFRHHLNFAGIFDETPQAIFPYIHFVAARLLVYSLLVGYI